MKNKNVTSSKSSSLRTKYANYTDTEMTPEELLEYIVKVGHYNSYKKYLLNIDTEKLSFKKIMLERQLDFVAKKFLKVVLIELENLFKNVFIHLSQENLDESFIPSSYLTDFIYSTCLKQGMDKKKLEILSDYFETIIRASKHSNEFSNYLKGSEEPPIWAGVHQMTFGQFLMLYHATSASFRDRFTKEINIVEKNGDYIDCFAKNKDLGYSMMELLKCARNIAMHDEVIIYGLEEKIIGSINVGSNSKNSDDLQRYILSIFSECPVEKFNNSKGQAILVDNINFTSSGSVLDVMIISMAIYSKNLHKSEKFKYDFLKDDILKFIELVNIYKTEYKYNSSKNMLKEHFDLKIFLLNKLIEID